MNLYRCTLWSVVLICAGLAGCGGGSDPSPPMITGQPTAVTVNTGASATFTVTAGGSVPLRYQWNRTDKGVTTSIADATNSTYAISSALLADSGVSFSVKVSNSVGNMSSSDALLTVLQPADWEVKTYHNDNARTGQNLSETQLTPATVSFQQFGKIGFYSADGKVDAQPLIVSNLPIGTVAHNVLYMATEHDSVYAYDADTGAVLWKTTLLSSGESPSDAHSCVAVVPEIGVSSTPVIDRASGLLYVIASSRGGNTYYHRLHALDLASGKEMLGGPTTISATYTGPGLTEEQVFSPAYYKERAALLLANGKIYTSWSSHCDDQPYSSWVIVLDASTLQITHTFNGEATGQSGEAAFWNSGSGPGADAAGNVYLLSANGLFDTSLDANGFPVAQNYGNSFLKLAPPASNSSSLKLLDYFTMFNTVSESNQDLDLGSGGGLLLPDQIDASNQVRHLIVGAGKDHNVYILDRDNMGKFHVGDNSQIWQELANVFPSSPNGIYGAPIYFNGRVYFGPSGDSIHVFQLANARLSAISMQPTIAFPYPGANPSISANGATNGILWAVENSSAQGVLHAYDANTLSELYNSNQAGARDIFGPGAKFNPATVANGKVYVCTQADLTGTVAGSQDGCAVFGKLTH